MMPRFTFVTLAPALLCLAEVPARNASVAATVNGQPITAEALDAAAREQLSELEEQKRRLRLTVLAKLIDNTLLDQAAREASLSLEEYLRRHVESVSVSDAEVEEAYRRNLFQFGGILAPEAKYRIRRSMEDARRADALRGLLESLRRSAAVTNYLLESQYSNLESANASATMGPPDAPIQIVEFADFECPFCRDAQAVLIRVMSRWPGKIRLTYRHLPLERHANAFFAAKAAVCAGAQGKFWPFVEQAFAEGADLAPSGLDAIATNLNVNSAEFAACLKSKEAEDQVRHDISAARDAGVGGTPALFVNRKPVSSAASLEATIEEELRSVR
jgi:protein-disulfide isomerase